MFFSKTVIIGKRALQARHQLGVSGNFRLSAIGRVFDEINVRLIRPTRSQILSEEKENEPHVLNDGQVWSLLMFSQIFGPLTWCSF